MTQSESSDKPDANEPFPNSRRIYEAGEIHPSIRVPLREVVLSRTRRANGLSEPNEAVRIYDCSGPWGDPNFHGDVALGLPALRRPWIEGRGDVKEVKSPVRKVQSLQAGDRFPQPPNRRLLRAKPAEIVTQLHYARQGIITPEMEFIAIRENLGRERGGSGIHGLRKPAGESFGASIPAR